MVDSFCSCGPVRASDGSENGQCSFCEAEERLWDDLRRNEAHAAPCSECGGSGVEEYYAGHGSVGERPCSACSPPSPPSNASQSEGIQL